MYRQNGLTAVIRYEYEHLRQFYFREGEIEDIIGYYIEY